MGRIGFFDWFADGMSESAQRTRFGWDRYWQFCRKHRNFSIFLNTLLFFAIIRISRIVVGGLIGDHSEIIAFWPVIGFAVSLSKHLGWQGRATNALGMMFSGGEHLVPFGNLFVGLAFGILVCMQVDIFNRIILRKNMTTKEQLFHLFWVTGLCAYVALSISCLFNPIGDREFVVQLAKWTLGDVFGYWAWRRVVPSPMTIVRPTPEVYRAALPILIAESPKKYLDALGPKKVGNVVEGVLGSTGFRMELGKVLNTHDVCRLLRRRVDEKLYELWSKGG